MSSSRELSAALGLAMMLAAGTFASAAEPGYFGYGSKATPEQIAGRVEKALTYVAAERLTLHPDCGFAPGSAADIPIDEAYQKLCNEAAAAELLRARRS